MAVEKKKKSTRCRRENDRISIPLLLIVSYHHGDPRLQQQQQQQLHLYSRHQEHDCLRGQAPTSTPLSLPNIKSDNCQYRIDGVDVGSDGIFEVLGSSLGKASLKDPGWPPDATKTFGH